MQAVNTKIVQDVLHLRHMTYLFLSSVYYEEVSLELLKDMRDNPPELQQLDTFFASLKVEDLEEVRRDLAGDFAQLFLGMSKFPVSPFESAYTSEEGLLMQEARDEVALLFKNEGLMLPAELSLPEDHIAFEFNFMAHLCDQEEKAIEAGNDNLAVSYQEKQKLFFEKHLENWIHSLCDDVIVRARTDFYRGLAELTKEFLREESAYFRGVHILT